MCSGCRAPRRGEPSLPEWREGPARFEPWFEKVGLRRLRESPWVLSGELRRLQSDGGPEPEPLLCVL